jgi:iron(III) transport system substrate-binding protein
VKRPSVARTGGTPYRIALAAVAVALITAACGGSEPAAPAPAPTPAPAPAPAPTPAPAELPPYELGVINLPPSEPVPAELIAAAQAEGVVNWYTGSTTFELVAAAFKEQYGIEVIANRQNSGAITRLYMQEAEAGAVVADLIQAFNPVAYTTAAERGYFAPLLVDEVPALGAIPADLVSEFWAPSNSWVWGFVWNTDLVPNGIKDWDDLLDPSLKGQIVMQDPRLGGLTAGIVNWMYDNLGPDYLRALGEQELQWVDSNVAALDRLAAGEVSVVIPTNKNNPDPLIEQGAPLLFGIAEAAPWFSHDLAISADAKSPNAARLLAHFLLSIEVQEAVSFSGPPVRPDGRSEFVMLPTWDLLVPDDVFVGESRLDEFIELLNIR